MSGKVRGWRRWLRRIGVLLLVGFVLLNGVAFFQARAMTHFSADGELQRPRASQPWHVRIGHVIGGVNVPRPRNNHTPAARGLAYETHMITVADGEQLEGWWVPHPESRGVVLLLPAYAQPKESLITPAFELYQWGYSSLLLDFRGAGGSSGDDTTLGIREAEDVAAAAAYIAERWPGQPLILYGVSMGTSAALRVVAVEGVKPAAVILEAPFVDLPSAVRRRFTRLGLPSFPAAELVTLWGSLQMGYNGFTHSPADYAAAIDCPVLIFYGENDASAPKSDAEAIAANLRGYSRVIEVPDIGHRLPFVLNAPDLWWAEVGPFLSRIGSE